jgi:histone arginine demethylase JMJD6
VSVSSTVASFATGPTLTDAVDRCDWRTIGRERYYRDYMLPLRPVIIIGALEHWGARTKWTPEFFRDHHFNLPAETKGGQKWLLGNLVERVLRSTPDAPAPYLQQHPIDDWPAELLADILPLPECTMPNWLDSRWFPSIYKMKSTEFFLGGPGAKFPFLHFDHWHMHAFLMQLYGTKEYVIFPPSETPYMYAHGGSKENISQIDNVDQPDLTRFPLLANARGFRFRLQPGETLYVPSGWWHTARILSPSITVAVSGANAANWAAFKRDMLQDHRARNATRAAAIGLYLSVF